MPFWGHDFDNKASSAQFLRSIRPMIHITTISLLVFAYYWRTVDKERELGEEVYKNPVLRGIFRAANFVQPHYLKYLDLIPVYESQKIDEGQ